MNPKTRSFFLAAMLLLAAACHPAGEIDKPESEKDSQPVMFGGFRFEVDTLFMKAGEKVMPQIFISPAEVSSQVKVHWMSADESVVQVDDEGVVTAVRYGATSLMAYINESLINPKKYYRSIPVFVSFNDPPLSNPEEAYKKWLGLWSLVGPAYITRQDNPETADYYAEYVVSINEKEPGETYSVVGWEKFFGPRVYSTDGSPYPGHPLTMTARFDEKTGRLLFLRSKSGGIFLTSYWNRSFPYFNYSIPHVSYSGSYGDYGFTDEEAIGYAEFDEGMGMAIVRGFYGWKGRNFYRQLGMGFSNSGGSALSDPFFFPVQMYQISDVPVLKLTISDYSLVLEVGAEYDLTVTVSPAEVKDYEIEWSSTDPAVATVSDGHIQTYGPGTTRITASVGSRVAFCNLTVKKPFIHFYSSIIRDTLCRRFDTDGDGELCFEEAAAVTSIGRINDTKIIPSFHELQYFTSVQELEERFMWNTGVRAVTIPANVRKIGDDAFTRNNVILIVTLLGPPPEIGRSAFGVINSSYDLMHRMIWVPDEYYDAYIEEAQVEGSAWSDYLPIILRVSERTSS